TIDEFRAEVQMWLATAKHPRWNRPYTDLAYQPMLEVLRTCGQTGIRPTWSQGASRTLLAWGPRKSSYSAPTGSRHRLGHEVRLRQGWQSNALQGAQAHAVR